MVTLESHVEHLDLGAIYRQFVGLEYFIVDAVHAGDAVPFVGDGRLVEALLHVPLPHAPVVDVSEGNGRDALETCTR